MMDEKPPIEEQIYQPYPMDPVDPELLKKKRRRRIIIIISIVFGGLIVLAGIAVLIIYLIGLSISQMCQNACAGCTCDCGCDEACSDACSNSCNNACANACDTSSCCSGDNITANAQTSDPGFDTQTYAKYVWETLKDWFYDLFN